MSVLPFIPWVVCIAIYVALQKSSSVTWLPSEGAKRTRDYSKEYSKEKKQLIETPLPIVYRKGNELTIKADLDEDIKNEVWGVVLPCGVIVSLDVFDFDWEQANKMAKELTLKRKREHLPSKRGHLPSRRDVREEFLSADDVLVAEEETELLIKTVRFLEWRHHIPAYGSFVGGYAKFWLNYNYKGVYRTGCLGHGSFWTSVPEKPRRMAIVFD